MLSDSKTNKIQAAGTTKKYDILLCTFGIWHDIYEKSRSLHLTTNT